MNQQDCIKKIKEAQDNEMDERKFADISYNFLLCNDNDDQQHIYEGRGWKDSGAHCIGYNSVSLGKNIFIFYC